MSQQQQAASFHDDDEPMCEENVVPRANTAAALAEPFNISSLLFGGSGDEETEFRETFNFQVDPRMFQ